MAEVLCAEGILKTGKIQSSTTYSIEKKPMLVRQSLRAFLKVSVQRKNMQRHCGGCLRNAGNPYI